MNASAIKADVLVIGAGVVGAATAYELALRGVDVAVVDAGADVGNGCSYANAGLLAPSHVEPLTTPTNVRLGARYVFRRDSPFHVTPSPRIAPWLVRFALASGGRRARALTRTMQELARRSLTMHGEYARRGLRTGYRQAGSMDVFLTEERFTAAVRRLGDGPHPGVRILTAAQVRAVEAGIGDLAGAIAHDDDATCETRAFARECLRVAQERGARVHWNTDVHRLSRDGDRITGAETSRGHAAAHAVVVAAGLGSQQLTARHGIRVPMLGGKGYVIDVPAQGQPHLPLTFHELKVVATPYEDRLRFCGTMDLGDSSDRLVPARVAAIRRAAARGLPAVDTSRPLQVWAGQRPCTADGIPVIGPSSVLPGLHLATGHGMWGLILAPVTAAVIAAGITEGPAAQAAGGVVQDRGGADVVGGPGEDAMAAFSPDRFTASGGSRSPAVQPHLGR